MQFTRRCLCRRLVATRLDRSPHPKSNNSTTAVADGSGGDFIDFFRTARERLSPCMFCQIFIKWLAFLHLIVHTRSTRHVSLMYRYRSPAISYHKLLSQSNLTLERLSSTIANRLLAVTTRLIRRFWGVQYWVHKYMRYICNRVSAHS